MARLCALILLAAISAGCTATSRGTRSPIEQVSHTVASAIGLEKPKPASEFACAWANKLHQLADPARGYEMSPGIVGQIFLLTDDLMPAEPNGDLTISVSDTTPRPAGQPPAKTEVWHFTSDVLRDKRVMDERFCLSIAIFLPWPAEWNDVKVLTIQGRYDQKDGLTLTCQPSTVTIDFSTTNGATAGGSVKTIRRLAAVPDPKAAMAAMRPVEGAWAAPMPVTNASVAMPSTNTPTSTPNAPMSGFPYNGRVVIPRR